MHAFYRPLALVFLSPAFLTTLHADESADDHIVIGQRRQLHSELLDEDRKLHVFTPNGYEDKNEESYPVLYLLDGPHHFHHTTGLVQFLADNDRIPEMIVVAIGNTNRTRDLTPSAGEMGGKTHGGGGDRFLEFLTTELAPWVEKEYRTKPYRVLIGHSFGGLFGIHALITRPDFYGGIIAISPSLQWDDQHTVAAVEKWLETKPDLDASIYMTVGSEGGGLLGGTMKVSGMLSAKAPKGLRWEFQHLPKESHTPPSRIAAPTSVSNSSLPTGISAMPSIFTTLPAGPRSRHTM